MSSSSVYTVDQTALESIATTIALAFADDPVWKWIYESNTSLPLETGIGLARMLAAGHLETDRMHMVDGDAAVALWKAPVQDEAEEERRDAQALPYAIEFARQVGERLAITTPLSAAMKEHRPQEEHWYLGVIGTHPDAQSNGHGTSLLQAMLRETDALGLPTYLESSNPRNYAFYRRHGYEEAKPFTVLDSPPLLGFFRPAR